MAFFRRHGGGVICGVARRGFDLASSPACSVCGLQNHKEPLVRSHFHRDFLCHEGSVRRPALSGEPRSLVINPQRLSLQDVVREGRLTSPMCGGGVCPRGGGA